MKSVEIAPNIYWVGSVDWNVRDFHGYNTHFGSTYNAYLIIDEKITLIDAVKSGFEHDMLEKISERIDPAKIDYIVSNHTEPDHSSTIGKILEIAPNATVVASEKGKLGLEKYFTGNWNYKVVKTGDTLSIGKDTLSFINTPMLHWPDSMFTYIEDRKLLFSMDAFGQHYASAERFDSEVDFGKLMYEAKVYYANIIMHLGSVVTKTLKQASELAIDMICPSHGVIWKDHINEIVSSYQDWSTCKPVKKVLVVYDSMWHSTEIMADAIASSVSEEGVEAKLLRLDVNDLTRLATEMLDTAAVAVGSSTLNNNMLPRVSAFLTYIKGLRPKGKFSMAFGSYGWSGGAVKLVQEQLESTGMKPACENIQCQFTPEPEILEQCKQAGKELARIAIEQTK